MIFRKGEKMKHCLVGKTIQKISIADDRKAILFSIDDGDIIAKTDGEYNSGSWIENVELPTLGFPAKVFDIEDINTANRYEREDDGTLEDDKRFVSYYACKIITDKGIILLDYRNESNGYYEGELIWPGDYFYGGAYGQNISNENWMDII